jgi:hypothetical protein
MELTKEFAEAIVNDFNYDDGDTFQCLSCNGWGDYAGNITHTSTCVVPKAILYLQETDGD